MHAKKSKLIIMPEEFSIRMRRLLDKYDSGSCDSLELHYEMDNLMCETLQLLGYDKGVKIFMNSGRR